MKWRGERYDLPNDPGFLTRAFWWLEDRWLALDPIDRHTILLVILVLLVLVVFEAFDIRITNPY